MKVLDLFSGIGGFSIGLERAGMETVAFCEIEEYPRKVLAKHWPDVPIYEDVRNVTREQLNADGIFPDVICGGFPCQDISVAGNQAGLGEETRSGLWSECARLLGDIQPKYAIFENVTALLNGGGGDWFKRVLWDISEVGYDAEWHCIPASELGAHHHRDRVWIIAYPKGQREVREGGSPKQSGQPRPVYSQSSSPSQKMGDSQCRASKTELQRQKQPILQKTNQRRQAIGSSIANVPEAGFWSTEPKMGRVANGVPNRSHRLKCLGNAVCPPVVEVLAKAIMDLENA